MKALCIAESGGDYIFQPQDDKPQVGRYYLLEDATRGTLAQNRLFHDLVKEYWKSGLHPTLGGDPYDDLRDWIKDRLGEGKGAYIYTWILANGELSDAVKVKKYEDVPEDIKKLYHNKKAFIFGKLKSWSDYTKPQRMKCIDNLIAEMTAAGVNSKKFMEILGGLNGKG